MILSQRSLDRLKGVHPDLIKVVQSAIAISKVDFMVLEGVRSVERQKALVAAGASQTMNSRHITGHAVDLGAIVNKQICWHPAVYDKIADAMLESAAKLNVQIICGASWVTFKDLCHFELNRKFYP